MKARKVFLALCLGFIAASAASSESIRLTVYDDGLSCPATCDAHVVFHRTLNGTEFAHHPSTPAAPFSKCKRGETCRLCIEPGGQQCLEAVYRGGGPPPKTFDFTTAFYREACASTPSQPALARKCNGIRAGAQALGGRLNCFADPGHGLCKERMDQARARQAADRVQYLSCLSKGEAAFNSEQAKEDQRHHACAYEKHGTGGPNSRGVTWRRLLPGVCRDGTLVGRDGFDCCSGDRLADGGLGRECGIYYPDKPEG